MVDVHGGPELLLQRAEAPPLLHELFVDVEQLPSATPNRTVNPNVSSCVRSTLISVSQNGDVLLRYFETGTAVVTGTFLL